MYFTVKQSLESIFIFSEADAPDGFGRMEREKLPRFSVSVGMSVKSQMMAAISSGLKQISPLVTVMDTVCCEKTIHADGIHYGSQAAAPPHSVD